ncbi:hypothetical protein [Rhizocola hellebori]|nr:hypothetical protein [Rhizocola hellebori]
MIVLVMLVAMAALKRNSVQTRPTVDVQTLPGPVDLLELANGRAIGPLGMVVAVPSGSWLQWAYIDSKGEVSGSPAAERDSSAMESVVKAWIAADFLMRDPTPSQSRLEQIRRMVRDNNDKDAQSLYVSLGADESIERMIAVCSLAHTKVAPGWWAKTTTTAADTARLSRCIGSGKAAGPKWTPWLLTELRQIRGQGAFGITQGLTVSAAPQVGYKNGWTLYEREWAVNCMAVADTWSLAIMQRYPKELNLEHGARNCAQIATQLILFMQASRAG